MSQVNFFGTSILCVIDDNFDLPGLKKSISKRTENEIVLSRTGAMLSVADLDLDRPIAPGRRRQGMDRQRSRMSLQELSRMRNT